MCLTSAEMATKQVNRKWQNSTSRHAKTPKPIFKEIGRRNYVLDNTRHANFAAIGLGVSAPKISDSACL